MASRSGDAKRGGCPICGAAAAAAYRPFCSTRCANVDLSRWLRGVYVVPGEQAAVGTAEDGEADKPHDAGQARRREL